MKKMNSTYYNATIPYCWYVVNAPPCYDTLTGNITEAQPQAQNQTVPLDAMDLDTKNEDCAASHGGVC
jgi:hypothetical protein